MTAVMEGTRRRDEGMIHVVNATGDAYRQRFHAQFDRLVAGGYTFCAEDIIKRVGKPSSPNAVGALFNAGVRRHSGMVEIVGYKPMVDASSHARRTPLYRSRG